MRTPPGLRTGLASLIEIPQLGLKLGDTVLNSSPVRFELSLSRSPCADATSEAAELHSSSPEPGEPVSMLSQFDLDPALAARSVLGEDVENQRNPVYDIAFEHLLQVALLSRAQFVVENDHIDIECLGLLGQLGGFSATYEQARVRTPPLDQDGSDGFAACGVGEQ